METDSSRPLWWYLPLAAAFALVFVPLATQLAVLMFGVLLKLSVSLIPAMNGLLSDVWLITLSVLVMGAVSGWVGASLARLGDLPESGWLRYLPLLVYPLLIWVVWIVQMQVSGGDFSRFDPVLFYLLLPFVMLLMVASFGGMYWALLFGPLWIYAAFVLGFWRASRRQPLRSARPLAWVLGLIVLCLAAITAWQALERQRALAPSTGKPLNEEVNLYAYQPFTEGNKLKPVQPPPTLRFDLPGAPRLDGAIAAYPLYAAAVQALYSKQAADARVAMTNTVKAYQRLIDGETDLIFVAQPSPAQRQRAAGRGVELSLTPVAKEAFVFIVHPDNPVQGLTLEQIRAIYSGRITNWRELGGAPGRIVAFQRPADSGSQTVMEARVMRGAPMTKPLDEERVLGMGGLLRQVAAFRAAAPSLGYTFRYYATQMQGGVPVRLLAIDGVAPTASNIRDGSYPLTVDVYMVTRQNPPAPVQQLMAWFLGPQGQRLIGDVGYVPLK